MPALALVMAALLIGSAGRSGAADDRIRIGWQPALSPGVHSAMLSKLYEYFDPIDTLPPAGQEYWAKMAASSTPSSAPAPSKAAQAPTLEPA